MDRIDEISAKCHAGRPVHITDVKYLLAEVERLKKHAEMLRLDYVDLLARAEKAEAERDAYKKALEGLERRISAERDGNKKRQHSIGVAVAIHRARELFAKDGE